MSSLTSVELRQKSKGQNQVTDISALLTFNGKIHNVIEHICQKLLF